MITNCLICDTPTTTRCTRCKSVYYCSNDHIAQDWPAHKAYCKTINAAGANTFDAILFAANENQPRLIKIPWSWVREGDAIPWQLLDRAVWFSDGRHSFPRPMYIRQINGSTLAYPLVLWYDDNFQINGSPINKPILNVTGGTPKPWAGNIFCLRDIPMDRHDNVNWDEDFDHIVQFLKAYGKRS